MIDFTLHRCFMSPDVPYKCDHRDNINNACRTQETTCNFYREIKPNRANWRAYIKKDYDRALIFEIFIAGQCKHRGCRVVAMNDPDSHQTCAHPSTGAILCALDNCPIERKGGSE